MSVCIFTIDADFADLYFVNGLDKPGRWNGLSAQFEDVGLDPPVAAMTIGSSGTGAIVGTYYAYERWVDSLGNFSNLNAVSVAHTAQGSTGTITTITVATPIVVTSAAHGLATGDWVKITGVGGVDQTNDTWQITVVSVDTFSLDESDVSGFEQYTGGGTWISGVSTITYSSVEVPTDSKVVRRQILRNTDGQTTTFYVDVDTTNLNATTFSSTLTDTLLAAGTAAPLLDSQGLPLANAHTKPLTFFKTMTQHLDRSFMGGLLEYSLGSCSVTAGSATVVGAGTAWKTTMAGRFLYIDGATQTYEVSSVNETLQTLTLTDNYADATDLFSFYSIKPPPAYRRIIAFTPAGEPQSWPAHMAITVQETGDEIVGVFQFGSYIYIAERAHLHKFTFKNNPLTDGAAFMAAYRGAVNQRCIVPVDGVAYMLDELGIHKFSGGSEIEAESTLIQSIFRTDDEVQWRINWHWKEFFHANLDRQRETIRFFVCLDGNRYPKHAICFQYRTGRFWVESYPVCIGGTCSGYLGGFQGVPQNYYGGQHEKVFASWTGPTDFVDPAQGAIRSTATSASAFSLTDTQQTWPANGMVNAPLTIVRGTGVGQTRRIVQVSGNALLLDMPWAVLPDTTSVYQIGGIPWVYRSGWFRLADSNKCEDRQLEILFEPMSDDSTATLHLFDNFSTDPLVQASTFTLAQGDGIASEKGSADMTIDLTLADGVVRKRLPWGNDPFIRSRLYVQFELSGVTHAEQPRIYQTLYAGILPPSDGG